MWRAILVLGAAAGGLGCRGSEARAFEGEVLALDRKIDALRQAPNEAKAPLLVQLEQSPCERAPVCELKSLCVSAYRTHQQGLSAAARARDFLAAPDGGTLASIQAAQELARADFELERAREQAERCASAQGALRRQVQARN